MALDYDAHLAAETEKYLTQGDDELSTCCGGEIVSGICQCCGMEAVSETEAYEQAMEDKADAKREEMRGER